MVYTYKYKVGTRLRHIGYNVQDIPKGCIIIITGQNNSYNECVYNIKVEKSGHNTKMYNDWIEKETRFKVAEITNWQEEIE